MTFVMFLRLGFTVQLHTECYCETSCGQSEQAQLHPTQLHRANLHQADLHQDRRFLSWRGLMNRILRSLRCHLCMLIAVTLLMAGFAPACRAESSATTEKHTRKIEKKVARYHTGTLLQVDFRDNSQALGFLGDVSGATFQITNAESNKLQTFNYDDVTRVKKTREYIG